MEIGTEVGDQQAMDVDPPKQDLGQEVKQEIEPEVEMRPKVERAASPIAPCVAHMIDLIGETSLSASEPVHEDKNLARYLVDYLLRQGYVKTAKAVTESAGIEVGYPQA